MMKSDIEAVKQTYSDWDFERPTASCQNCQRLSAAELCQPNGYQLGATLDDLAKHCADCSFAYDLFEVASRFRWWELLDHFEENSNGKGSSDGPFTVHFVQSSLDYHLSRSEIEIRCGGEPLQSSFYAHFNVRTINGTEEGTLKSDIPSGALLSDSGSPGFMELARRWLSNCLSTHDCQRLSSSRHFSGTRPARLLRVANPNEDGRLVDLSESQEDRVPNYACLSHPWGPLGLVDSSKTLQSNLLHRKSGIAYMSFPKTFREAMDLVRSLGLDYIWIDALCIIQDSPDDWDQEAAKMGAIYALSTVTVAADVGLDADSGCFVKVLSLDRPDSLVQAFHVTSPLGDSPQSLLFWPRDMLRDRSSKVLSSRGWCLQERVLSPRVIHCEQQGLFWECWQDRRSVGGASPQRNSTDHAMIKWLSSDHAVRRYEWYSTIVPDYSGRNLTYATDRLPAISAVARVIGSDMATSYVAGVWECDVAIGLSWMIDLDMDNAQRARSPEPPPRPSWSWVPHNMKVKWRVRTADSTIAGEWRERAIATHIVMLEKPFPVLADPYLDSTPVSLRLKGRMKRIHTCTDHLCPERDEYSNSLSLKDPADYALDYTNDYESSLEDFYMLHLLTSEGLSDQHQRMEYFLILSKVDTVENGYERRGILRTDLGYGPDDRREEWFGFFSEETIILV